MLPGWGAVEKPLLLTVQLLLPHLQAALLPGTSILGLLCARHCPDLEKLAKVAALEESPLDDESSRCFHPSLPCRAEFGVLATGRSPEEDQLRPPAPGPCKSLDA